MLADGGPVDLARSILPCPQLVGTRRVDVKADHRTAGARKGWGERNANIEGQ
jgi:hypothetical protein